MITVILDKVKNFLEAQPEENWIVKDLHDGSKHCALGHLYASNVLTLEERHILQDEAKAFLVASGENFNMHALGHVNDGNSTIYTQPTPKQRVMNFLNDFELDAIGSDFGIREQNFEMA